MSAYAAAAAEVGLPLLEVVNIPLISDRNLALAGTAALTFDDRAVGTVDATAIGGILTELNSSYFKPSALATPTQFTFYSCQFKYPEGVSHADLTNLFARGRFAWRLGPKEYIIVPLRFIPSGVALVTRITAAAESVSVGLESIGHAYDVTVPEQAITPEGKAVDTDQRAPMFLPPEQIHNGRITLDAAYAGAAAMRIQFVKNGFLRREVS